MDLTVRDVIDRLGGNQAVAAAVGVATNSVCYWRCRNSIPIQHHDALIQLARKVGEPRITLELLVRLAAARGRSPSAQERSRRVA